MMVGFTQPWSVIALVVFILQALPASAAGNNTTQLSEQLGALPQCAMQCGHALPATTCDATDVSCLCAEAYPINASSAVEMCILHNCDSHDQLATQKIISNICGRKVRDDGPTLLAVDTAFCAVAFIFGLIRLGVRAKSWELLGLDDVFIFVAVALSIVMLAATYMQVKFGLARDPWGNAYDDQYGMFYWIYITQIFYVCCTFLTKLSVLYFYTRVFTNTSVATGAYVLIGLTAAAFVAVFFATVFQCTPISLVWTIWDMQHQGTCVPPYTMVLVNSVPDIALDSMILLLPLPTIFRLHLKWRRKLGLIVVFSLGIITIITAALRLESILSAPLNPFDLTYTIRLSAYWSLIEVDVGIICVCLPAIRPFLRVLREACFGKSVRESEAYHKDSRKSGHRTSAHIKISSISSPILSPRGQDGPIPDRKQANVEMDVFQMLRSS